MKAKIFQDKQGQYRWHLLADNNRIIATGAEGYHNLEDAYDGLTLVSKGFRSKELEVEFFLEGGQNDNPLA